MKLINKSRNLKNKYIFKKVIQKEDHFKWNVTTLEELPASLLTAGDVHMVGEQIFDMRMKH